MRKLLAFAVAAGLVTVSGAAFSGNPWYDVTLMQYDPATELVVVGQYGGYAVYVHNDATVHLPGVIAHAHQYPPDPCDGFKQAYNQHLQQFANGVPGARQALIISIVHLSNASCPAELEINANDGVSIVTFKPK